jgi:hypothetical protein
MNEYLEKGKFALQNGKKEEALYLLMMAINVDRDSAAAWFWLSRAVDTKREKIFCLREVMSIDLNYPLTKKDLLQLEYSDDTSFDWTQFPQHVLFLRFFVDKPRSVIETTKWGIRHVLKEAPLIAIERLIKIGALENLDYVKSLSKICKMSEIRQLSKIRGIKGNGSKEHLIFQLAKVDPEVIKELMKRDRWVQCSEFGKKLIKDLNTQKELIAQRCFQLLLENNIQNAYELYTNDWQKYLEINNFDVTRLSSSLVERILSAKPQSLNKLSRDSLRYIQALASTNYLLFGTPVVWQLPSNFPLGLTESITAIYHILNYIEIKDKVIKCSPDSKIKIIFDTNDRVSCPLCRKLDQKEYLASDFPDLPLEGCTGGRGCQCNLEFNYVNAKEPEWIELLNGNIEDEWDDEEFEDGDMLSSSGKTYRWDGTLKKFLPFLDENNKLDADA